MINHLYRAPSWVILWNRSQMTIIAIMMIEVKMFNQDDGLQAQSFISEEPENYLIVTFIVFT